MKRISEFAQTPLLRFVVDFCATNPPQIEVMEFGLNITMVSFKSQMKG